MRVDSHKSRRKPLELDRRAFLRCALWAGALLPLSFSCATNRGRIPDQVPQPCSPDRWTKHGVILEASEPWEGADIQNFTTRAEPLSRGRWRLWYSRSGGRDGYGIAYAEGVPGHPMTKTPAVCSPDEPADAPLAIGNLPALWKPVQPVHIQLPQGIHRLYFWAHGPGICRYLAAESHDGRRYRVLDPLRPVLYHPGDRAARGVANPGAKAANRPADEPPAPPGVITNDATNVYLMPDGSFELYTAALVEVPKTDPAYVAEDNAPGRLRVIDRLTSADGLHFENRRRVIQRDAGDPVDQQFYYLAVTRTPRGRVGLLGHYRCAAQTMDLEWCFSADGTEWKRPLRRAWLRRGAPPAADCYGIYGGSHLVRQDGRWHLFYTGVNSAHNGKQSYGPPRQVILWATTESIWA